MIGVLTDAEDRRANKTAMEYRRDGVQISAKWHCMAHRQQQRQTTRAMAHQNRNIGRNPRETP
jgi:hypothetical protein